MRISFHARRPAVSLATVCVASCLSAARAHGFAYVFADNANPNRVTHPFGYSGTGKNYTITVGIDPTSVNAASMVVPAQNAIAVWNGLVPTTNNLKFGTDNNVGATQFDFESALLHEMGHALGLTHPNLGGSATSSDATEYTQSGKGPNGTFQFDAGTDGVIGSADDVRGDDVNLNWFQKANNNPFTIAGVVDTTTYSQNLADLPAGHLYSSNASRDVATRYGLSANTTEASLQQGQSNDEAQRTLGHDDVAGIRFAESGLDSVAGTSDDYTFTLTYSGMTAAANIVLDFDSSKTSFAVTSSLGTFLDGTHLAITDSDIFFTETPGGGGWFFNQVPVPEPTVLTAAALGGLVLLRGRKR